MKNSVRNYIYAQNMILLIRHLIISNDIKSNDSLNISNISMISKKVKTK